MKKTIQPDINKNYFRVTEILSPYVDFSHIDEQVLANACDRGTRVHTTCEAHLKNLFIPNVDEDVIPYFDSFKIWADKVLDGCIEIEKRLYCDDILVTGQIDLICTLKGDPQPIIVDIKTPQQMSKSWQLQTAAYRYLVKNHYDDNINRRAVLRLDRNGKNPVFTEYTNHEIDERLFLNAVELYKYFNG